MKEFRVKVSVRNNLILRAIEAEGYKSVAAFAKANGLQYVSLNEIISMKKPPINQNGEFSNMAKELMEILGACPSDLWTTEQLNLQLGSNTIERDVDLSSMKAVLGNNLDMPRLVEMPEESAQNEELGRLMNQALEGVTTRERTVLDLRHKDGLTYAEIAKSVGVTPQRIRDIESRALRKLRNPSLNKTFRSYRPSWTGEKIKKSQEVWNFNHETKEWFTEIREWEEQE